MRQGAIVWLAMVAAGAGCAGADGWQWQQAAAATAPSEDGLAEAYGIFEQTFVNDAEDQRFHLGFGFHPGLSSAKIVADGVAVSGQATIDFAAGLVTAHLHGPTDGVGFDLYFVQNRAGYGTVKPEPGDRI